MDNGERDEITWEHRAGRIMEDVVKRQILYVIVVLVIAFAAQAGLECSRWANKEVTGTPDGMGMQQVTYDKNFQKVVLFPIPNWPQLWTYDGLAWNKIWEGQMDMAGHPWWFLGSYLLYFDINLNTLVLVGWVQYGFEQGGVGIFRFSPDQGFRLIADYNAELWAPWASYDWRRKKVVIGGHVGSSGMTVEYDGSTFNVVQNPPGYTMADGVAAYDPSIEKTVYFGANRDGYGLETLEWDGIIWTTIPTKKKPLRKVNSMVHVPEFQGLIAVVSQFEDPDKPEPIETWLYKNSEWRKIDAKNSPTSYLGKQTDSFLAFDEYRNKVILGGVPSHVLIYSTWELESAGHCRPLIKP